MKKTLRKCILDSDRWCDDCGECDRCDLDPEKICNNCMKCLNLSDADYLAIEVDDILMNENDTDD